MRAELLAYLLGDLDPDERERVAERIANDPVWQQELATLKACLKAREAEAEPANEPVGLVDRTCSYVQQAASQKAALSCAEPASLSESHDPCVSAARWSFLDLAVGAVVLLAVGMLILPAIHNSRDSARQMKCQSNLRDLGIALVEYANRFDRGLPHIELGENAGIFVVDLAESGLLSREQLAELLICPSSPLAADVFAGNIVIQIPSREDLGRVPKESLELIQKWMSGSYAYRIGFFDQQGRYCRVKFERRADSPVLADAPSSAVAGFRSPNHGGCGQNVVFQDLSVRYFQQCLADGKRDHLFLNEELKHAAGRHAQDVVLARSEADPAGR